MITFRGVSENEDVIIGTAIVWLGASVFFVIAATDAVSRVLLRLYVTKRRSEILIKFRNWGMEREAFGESSVFVSVVLCLWTIGTLYATITFALPVVGEYTVDNSPYGWSAVLLVVIFLQFRWVMNGYKYIDFKRQKLEALPKVFYERFSVSEILSMYECLRAAPGIFWEEYTNLQDWQVSRATNQVFRERVAPFGVSQADTHQRAILVLTILTVGVALLSLLNILVDSPFVEWVERQIFQNRS